MALKRIFVIVVSLLLSITYGSAQTADDGLLNRFETSLKAMGCYCVEFVVAFEEHSSKWRYVVDGDDFYVQSEGIEVYVSDGVKYEVNGSRKEITIDGVASLGSDIISNPSRGFATLAEGYDVVATEVEGRKVLHLTPKSVTGLQATERIVVAADASGELPSSVRYEMGGDAIEIRITSITKAEKLPRYRAEDYSGFEVVDLR